MKDLTSTRGRLTLREWTLEDSDFVYDMYSRWEVQRFLGETPRILVDPLEATEMILRWQSNTLPMHGVWAVTSSATGATLGTAFLKAIPTSIECGGQRQIGVTEIGWHLHPRAWGNGFASEAAETLLDHAFSCGLERVIAVTYPENTASHKVCQQVGMKYEGPTRAYYNNLLDLYTAIRPQAIARVDI